jgi:hypothetical protein
MIAMRNFVALHYYGGGKTFWLKASVLGDIGPCSSCNYAMEFTLKVRKIT